MSNYWMSSNALLLLDTYKMYDMKLKDIIILRILLLSIVLDSYQQH